MPLIIVFFSVLLTNFSALADNNYYNVPEMTSTAKEESLITFLKLKLKQGKLVGQFDT